MILLVLLGVLGNQLFTSAGIKVAYGSIVSGLGLCMGFRECPPITTAILNTSLDCLRLQRNCLIFHTKLLWVSSNHPLLHTTDTAMCIDFFL
jgi:hypothetical protein